LTKKLTWRKKPMATFVSATDGGGGGGGRGLLTSAGMDPNGNGGALTLFTEAVNQVSDRVKRFIGGFFSCITHPLKP
jgi:hypothetical protein